MSRIVTRGLLVVSMFVAGCAVQDSPTSTSEQDENAPRLQWCVYTDQCSTTGDEFSDGGLGTAGRDPALAACKAACPGGTCKVISIQCDPNS
jgi:hypothetical protein